MQATRDELFELVESLAIIDATLSPLRLNAAPLDALRAMRSAERRFRTDGLPIDCKGDVNERKQRERELIDLEARGLIRTVTRKRRRVGFHLMLNTVEHLRWRAFAGGTVRDQWGKLKRLANWPASATNCGFALEIDLLGMKYSDQGIGAKLSGLEFEMAGLLLAGLVEWSGDTDGRIGWRITPQGRAALRGGPPPAPTLPKMEGNPAEVRLCDELHETYLVAYRTAEADRLTATPDPSSPIVIPLSAGRWPKLPATASRKPQEKAVK